MKPANWILRALVLLGMALLFIPTIGIPLPGKKPKLIILIDASRSMSDKTKLQSLRTLLENLRPLKKRFSIESYEFADSLENSNSANSSSKINFIGSKTDIGKVLEEVGEKDCDAALLVSDGRHNGYIDPTLKKLTFPLWTFGVGQADLPDIVLEEVSLDDSTNQSNKVLNVKIRSNLKSQTKTNLHVYSGGKVLRTIEVKLIPEMLTEIKVPISLSDSLTTLRIILDTIANEDRTDNNSRNLTAASRQEKVSLLFVAGFITGDTRELLLALREMSRFSLASRIELAYGKFLEEEKNKPDIIIVGPFGSNRSSPTVDSLKKYLNSGIPVIFVNATQSLPAPLRPFLPLEEQLHIGTNKDIYTPLSDILFRMWEPQEIKGSNKIFTAANNAQIIYSKVNTGFISVAKPPLHSLGLEFPALGSQVRTNRKGFESFLETSILYVMNPEVFPFSIREIQPGEGYAEITLHSEVPIQMNELKAWLTPDSHSLEIVPASSQYFKMEGPAPRGAYNLNILWRGKLYSFGKTIEVAEPVKESPSRGANYELLEQLARNNHGQFLTDREGINDFASSLPKKKTLHLKPVENPILVILIGSLLLLEIWLRRKNGLP